MTTRSAAKWHEIGENSAAADLARHVRPATGDAEVRQALAYHHCADLDDPEIAEQTQEGREAALDALVNGYLSTFPAAPVDQWTEYQTARIAELAPLTRQERRGVARVVAAYRALRAGQDAPSMRGWRLVAQQAVLRAIGA